MITLSFPDLVALTVLFITLFVLLDRRALLREMKRTRREVKALREALTMQGKPTRRGHIPPILRQKVIERCEYTCQYCGGIGDAANGPDGLPWHVDHVVPVVKGGPTHDGNLTLSCAACNLSKGALQAEEFNGGVLNQDVVVLSDQAEIDHETGATYTGITYRVPGLEAPLVDYDEDLHRRLWDALRTGSSLKGAQEKARMGYTGGTGFYLARAVRELGQRHSLPWEIA